MLTAKFLTEFFRLRRNAAFPPEEIRRLQAKELRQLLRYAYENSPYYRRAFEAVGITTANIDAVPLRALPTLDKETLMRHFDELVTAPYIRQAELDAFILLAQADPRADKAEIRRQIAQVLSDVLAEKKLNGVHFAIEFAPQLLPDTRTGKKRLIVALPQWEMSELA